MTARVAGVTVITAIGLQAVDLAIDGRLEAAYGILGPVVILVSLLLVGRDRRDNGDFPGRRNIRFGAPILLLAGLWETASPWIPVRLEISDVDVLLGASGLIFAIGYALCLSGCSRQMRFASAYARIMMVPDLCRSAGQTDTIDQLAEQFIATLGARLTGARLQLWWRIRSRDDDRNGLTKIRSLATAEELTRQQRLVEGDDLLSLAFRRGRTQTRQDGRASKETWLSELAIPIPTGGDVAPTAALWIGSMTPRRFRDVDVAALERVADEMAPILARPIEADGRTDHATATGRESTKKKRTPKRSGDLRESLSVVHRELWHNVSTFDEFRVYSAHPKTHELTLVYRRGAHGELDHDIDLPETALTRHVFTEQNTYCLERGAEEARERLRLLVPESCAASYLGALARSPSGPCGVVELVCRRQRGIFGPSERSLLEVVGEIVGAALERSRDHAELRWQRVQMAILHKAGKPVRSMNEFTALANEVAEDIHRRSRTLSVAIDCPSPTNPDVLVRIARRGELVPTPPERVDDIPDGILMHAPPPDDSAGPNAVHGISIPIRMHEETLGVIHAGSQTPIQAREMEVLTLVSVLLGVAYAGASGMLPSEAAYELERELEAMAADDAPAPDTGTDEPPHRELDGELRLADPDPPVTA